MVGVVDDRDDVWSDYLSNLYRIEPYAFWKVKPKEEVNNSSGESLAEKAPAEKGEAVLDPEQLRPDDVVQERRGLGEVPFRRGQVAEVQVEYAT